jgi:type III restriction enzyme
LAQATATIIENPVINSPFIEPQRHFVMEDGQPTGQIEARRRSSEFFVPVARPRKASQQQLTIDYGGLTRQQPNEIVNEIRQSVARWRTQDYPHTTSVTRDLLSHWQSEDRERRLFFCQLEAAETAIYLTEAAERTGDTKALNVIRQENATLNGGLPRLAFKMATGSGKTVVMAMLIAWQALNKQANPQDRRFSDKFLIVTPGITIRDRLRVLLPNDPGNYYRQLEILTSEQIDRLQSATIVITNFHAFMRREKIQVASLTKKVLTRGEDDDRFKETPAEMVRRLCRDFGNAKNIVVLNDEAHHCYAPAPKEQAEEGALDADERTLARKDAEEARVWLTGLQAVQEKLDIRAVYDLSATPFFLKGSGYAEGTLFPWVASDFGLMDAIESGIVKIPRVPVSDDSMTGESPMYRDLWVRVRDALPRKSIKDTPIEGKDPIIPKELEGALRSLYDDYERSHATWAEAGMGTPPVFIVVCSNTATSKLVSDWISGWQKPLDDGTTINVPGNLPLFGNVRDDGLLLDRPNTLLVDSAQLDRGDALDPAFRKAAHAEIDKFKHEYVTRFPGRSAEDITDEDILREVMNTVGKKGRLGEHIRCVVSVAMLTEGWDANTVTHILGIRAFGTQLLCEQVVGRALRRASYDADADSMFEPEYAEVYGVPFSFLSVSGKGRVKRPRHVREVRALAERAHLRIEFPRVIGYRFELPTETLTADFDATSILQLSPRDVATETQLDPIIGERELHKLDLRDQRMQTVAFTVAKRTLDNHFRDDDGADRPWLFPQLARIAQQWIEECVKPYMQDNAYAQLLLLAEYSHSAAEKIQRAVYRGTKGEKRLMPNLRPYEHIGSTDDVWYETTKVCFETEKSHINLVPQDSGWESKLAEVLEGMPEVVAYAKNQGLNFKIPYTYEGRPGNYVPDFLIRLRDAAASGEDDLLTLVLEVSGEPKKEKAAKVQTAHDVWTAAVNNWGGLGRWAFLEITDPWDAESLIREKFVPVTLVAVGG